MKTVILIVAMAKNGAIGKNNQLLWHLPNDLKHFKALTTGKPIVMGRKTFESIGKPLPNRQNIVLTQQRDFISAGIDVVHTVEEALAIAQGTEVMVMGGAQIYQLFFPLITKMYITYVQAELIGDVYFPPFDHSQWHEIAKEQHHQDEKHAFDYCFVTLERVQA